MFSILSVHSVLFLNLRLFLLFDLIVTELPVTIIRPLEERLVRELPASVSFECEFSRADLNVHWTRDSRPLASDSKSSIGRFGQVHRATLQLNEEDMLLGDEELGHEVACVVSKELRTSAKLQVAGESRNFTSVSGPTLWIFSYICICIAVLL